jgi:hypothetical protein
MIIWNQEKQILKVVEWAHRKNINIELLTKEQIIFALQAYLRDSSHS